MTGSAKRTSTLVSRIIRATRESVYNAFLDPDSVSAWLPPNNMAGKIHVFESRVGGRIHMSLIYKTADHPVAGKTAADTDRFQGRFVELVPYSKIVEMVEFDSPDPAFAGEMIITVTLSDVEAGTQIDFLCENIPFGIRPEDNEQGCKESLEKLAALLE